jgi:hypothetical protein
MTARKPWPKASSETPKHEGLPHNTDTLDRHQRPQYLRAKVCLTRSPPVPKITKDILLQSAVYFDALRASSGFESLAGFEPTYENTDVSISRVTVSTKRVRVATLTPSEPVTASESVSGVLTSDFYPTAMVVVELDTRQVSLLWLMTSGSGRYSANPHVATAFRAPLERSDHVTGRAEITGGPCNGPVGDPIFAIGWW